MRFLHSARTHPSAASMIFANALTCVPLTNVSLRALYLQEHSISLPELVLKNMRPSPPFLNRQLIIKKSKKQDSSTYLACLKIVHPLLNSQIMPHFLKRNLGI